MTTDSPASGPRLTGSQRRPLEVRGASVALSAGAGCGKTTVLTSRFLLTLEEATADPLGSVVAMTFTEKAARELRQRIRQACHVRLEVADDAETAFWRGVLRGLEAAPISTFHEFCGNLLRQQAVSARLDPDFEILDAAIAGSVRDEAVARTLRRWLAESNLDLVELAVEFGLSNVRENISRLVSLRDAGELARWADRTEDDLLAIWEAAFQKELLPRAGRRLTEFARVFGDWCHAQGFEHPKLQKLVSDLDARFHELETRLWESAWLADLRSTAMMPRVAADGWPSQDVKEDCQARLKSYRDEIDRFSSEKELDPVASRDGASHGLRYARLALEARRAYDSAKLARGALDFDDLLVKTRDLLRGEGVEGVAAGPEYTFILVDEFQDTDPVQSEILRHLAGDGFSTGDSSSWATTSSRSTASAGPGP
ncbi:MAG: UvrD-helicase domain-containing protein [Isosphaeraceae bacterium]